MNAHESFATGKPLALINGSALDKEQSTIDFETDPDTDPDLDQ